LISKLKPGRPMNHIKKKIQKKELSELGKAIKNIGGVTNLNEKKPETPDGTNAISHIGSFTFNEVIINYIIIESNENKFINLRMNAEYPKTELPNELNNYSGLLNHLNKQNSMTIGIKFFIASEDHEKFVISSNSEYILDKKVMSYSFISTPISILSTALRLLGIEKNRV